MGWSFRKSVGFGPLRLNLSKGGVGVSTGVKGARVSVGPGGTRVYGGWGPFRYQKRVGGSADVPGMATSGRGSGGRTMFMLVVVIAVTGAIWAARQGYFSAAKTSPPAKSHTSSKSHSAQHKTHKRAATAD